MRFSWNELVMRHAQATAARSGTRARRRTDAVEVHLPEVVQRDRVALPHRPSRGSQARVQIERI
eukprot:859036-Pleurochrysis_carterae.AAC.2